MAIPTLSGSYIDETYGRLVQVIGAEFADGFGNPISFGAGTLSGGITGYIPLWSGSTALQNSAISQSGNLIEINGGLNVTNGITGSLNGTASWAYNVVNIPNIDTSSFVLNSMTASMLSNYVLNSHTSSFVTNSQTGSFVTNSQTSSFVTNSQTGSFVTNSQTSSFVTNNQTGSFVLNSQTSSFVTNSQTSSFVTNSQTSSFVTNSQTSSITVLSSSYSSTASYVAGYVQNSQTSSFITTIQTGSFATTGSNIFRGDQTISGSITQNASTASFGGLVGIGTTTPTYTLDISGSLEVVSKRYTIGQQIGQYQKVAYQMGPGDPTYTSQYQQYITTLSGSIGQWKFSNNLTGYLSTTNAIGYAENNHNTIYSWNVSNGTIVNTFVYARNTEIVGIPGLNWQEWFTPTKDELARLWGNKNSLGITNPTSGFFWSSTDINTSTAWAIDWESGNMVAKTKTTAYDILPIRYLTIYHAPSSLQFDNDGLRLYDIGAGSTGYNLQYDTTTGQIKYTDNPSIPPVPSGANVDQINIPDGADVYVRPGELEQSKYSTINIFNNINFT